MRRPTYLETRGAKHMLDRARDHVHMNPWEPGWSYPNIDKYGNAQSTEDASDILRKAARECSTST